ncbi:venom carboxylesterase-6 [Folsomia candida]|uniref:venom carboxylesterase-6 n=1 Tax=Folsomia candida TaxID=158441 RepID=UPI000B8F7FB5|nr:venom carboxylesterase-6 [Folsomia candida]
MDCAKLVILLVVCCLCGVWANEDGDVVVHISTGEVHGATGRTGRDHKIYYFFKGIPFGKVEKRFEDSKPADKWDTPLKAVNPSPGCVTSGMIGGVQGVEDCLTLDVYMPKLPTKNGDLLPVMVWIYGGAFIEGSSNQYGGSYFMESDTPVVLVALNYRLGVLGFLNTGTASAPGNQGLKDQVLGLRWVQENIAAFGGDKNSVTIFGESAGSISASMMTLSPLAQGLFHRAIMQSGNAILPFFYKSSNGPALAKMVGRELDCPTSNMEYLVKCLERIDHKLFAPLMKFFDEIGWDGSGMFMGPSIETYKGDGHSVFLDQDPYQLALAGKFSKVSIIMGVIGWECYAMAIAVTNSQSASRKLNAQWGRLGTNLLFLADTAEDPAHVINAIRDHFIPEKVINSTTQMKLEEMESERHWIYPFRTMAALYAKHVPVYLYNFTQQVPVLSREDPELKQFKPKLEAGQTRRIPSHGDELPYLFEITGVMERFYEPISKGSDDVTFAKGIISTWTAFAKTGKPTGPWGHWPTLGDNDDKKIMHLEDPPRLMAKPDNWAKNDKFWQSLRIKQYGKEWQNYEEEAKENCI